MDGALAEYRTALSLHPNHDDAHHNLGNALDAKGDRDGAIAEYRTALRLNPNNSKAHGNLAAALKSKGNTMEAAQELHEFLHLTPDTPASDSYLRTLLIHGARSVLLHARTQQPDRLRRWAHELAKTHVHNKAAVAVANKMARIVWAVWTRSQPYKPVAA